MAGSDGSRGRDRNAGRAVADWVLLEGDRVAVAALLVLATWIAAVLIAPSPPITSANAQPLFYAFSALLGGNLNLLTIVVSVNQLVLTRELKSPGKYRTEQSGVGEFRRTVEGLTDVGVAPTEPAAFVDELAAATIDAAEAVAEERTGGGRAPDGAADELATLTAELRRLRSRLDDPNVATLGVLRALIAVDLADPYRLTRQLREGGGADGRQPGDDGSAGAADGGDGAVDGGPDGERPVDRLASQLEALDVAREHVKQLFTRGSLSNMSRVLLYVGVPTEAVVLSTLLAFVGVFPPTPEALSPEIVYGAAAIGLAPLAITFAFVVRSATVAHRTATDLQFTA